MFYNDSTNYITLLPDVMQEVAEIDAVGGSVNIQVDKLNAYIKQWANNKSIANADLAGVERWEKILGVSAPMNSSLTARKDALKAKLIAKPPINLQTLKAIIEAYMGLGVDIVVANHLIKVWYRGESRIADLAPLYQTVYEIIPASLILQIVYRYLIWNELDMQNLTFDLLDALGLDFTQLEKGEWIDDNQI